MKIHWGKQEKPRTTRPVQKKGKCIIKFKKTPHGEQIEFTPECRADQIEMAKNMREEKRERGED